MKVGSNFTQGDVALLLPLVAHPRLTADMRFGSCRASTQIASQLLISADVARNHIYEYHLNNHLLNSHYEDIQTNIDCFFLIFHLPTL